MSDLDPGTELLSSLAHEFVERLRRGDDASVEQLAMEHPELATEIRELFPVLHWMEGIDLDATASEAHHELGDEASRIPSQLGEYRILRRIARGGMGTVYEAVQESLGRHVALKVLTPHDSKNATLLERFKREAQAAAQLHHTNIVPVFGVGESVGIVYYAMQLIQGQPLDRVFGNEPPGEAENWKKRLHALDEDYYRAIARLGAQAASALAYAHAEGVLHRDIKPANLLLDGQGTLWITDFGLARIEGLSDLTVAEDVIGTLRYMPPERFEGRTDARGDIYSLGLTLYELLIRRPAFGSASRAELVRRILHESPPVPRSVEALVPRDLETIVMKAISREPNRRYETAADMAEDLRRFCADRPILARRTSIAERSQRWFRKNPVLAIVSSLATLMLLTVAGVSTFAYFRENSLRGNLAVALERTEQAELQSREELFISYIATAQASRLGQRQGQRLDSLAALHHATQLLNQLELSPAELEKRRDDLRDLAISCLALPDIREVGDLAAHGSILNFFHLDQFAQRDATGTLIVSQWPIGTELFRLPDINEHTAFAFTPNRDEMLLIDEQTHTLNRWQFGETRSTLIAHLDEYAGSLASYTVSRDSRRLLLIRESKSDCLIEVLDWPSGRHRTSRKLPYLTGVYPAARLSHDGRMLAIIGGEYRSDEGRLVTVTDVDSGAELVTLEHAASVASVAWHPDSQTLAVGLTDSNDVVLWNVPQKKQLASLNDQRGGGPWLCMNSTGELLCSSSTWTRQVNFWHPYLGKLLLKMPETLLFNWNTNDGRLIGESRLANGDWQYVAAEPSSVVRTLAPIQFTVPLRRGGIPRFILMVDCWQWVATAAFRYLTCRLEATWDSCRSVIPCIRGSSLGPVIC